jgi:hypothetical protein
MNRAPICTVLILLTALPLTGAAADDASGSRLEFQLRERAEISLAGRKEVWQLIWLDKTQDACGPQDVLKALVATCNGFAYGQRGHLLLVRIVEGQPLDELVLDQFFGLDGDDVPDGVRGVAFLPQREFKVEDASGKLDPASLLREVAQRPIVKVMQFADYDYDGQASEFLLQIGTLPAGKRMMVLIGITRSNPKLHVFRSAEEPGRPLVAGAWVWEALRASAGNADVIEWACGDHGSDHESRIHLQAGNGILHVARSQRQCADQ